MSKLLERKTVESDLKLNKMFLDVAVSSIEGLAFGAFLSIFVKNKVRMITIGSGIFAGAAYGMNNGNLLFNRKQDEHMTKRREKLFWSEQYESRKNLFSKLSHSKSE